MSPELTCRNGRKPQKPSDKRTLDTQSLELWGKIIKDLCSTYVPVTK